MRSISLVLAMLVFSCGSSQKSGESSGSNSNSSLRLGGEVSIISPTDGKKLLLHGDGTVERNGAVVATVAPGSISDANGQVLARVEGDGTVVSDRGESARFVDSGVKFGSILFRVGDDGKLTSPSFSDADCAGPRSYTKPCRVMTLRFQGGSPSARQTALLVFMTVEGPPPPPAPKSSTP